MAKNNSSTGTKKSSFLKILWWALTPILITLIFFGVRSMIPKKETPSFSKMATASAQTQKTEWIMSLLATDKQMERENKQKPYSELTVCELFSNDSEIRVTYINAVGKKETTKLTRWRKDSFYGGWYANTHPEKRRENVEFSLLKDEEAPFYLEGASAVKVKISPQFKGYLGKNEIEVRIFKRVSSG